MKEKERFSFISYAKCIAILLVCIGHFLPKGNNFKVVIYVFHVPIFFVIAGFLFKRGENKPRLGSFLLGRLKRLVAPYLIFYTLSYFWYVARYDKSPGVKYFFKTLFFHDGNTLWNSAIWFLPTMILVSTLFYFLVSRKGKSYIPTAAVAILCFAATALIQKKGYDLSRLGIDKAIHMMLYMCVGFLARNIYDYVRSKQEKKSSGVGLSLTSLLIFSMFCTIAHLVNKGNRISILYNDYNDILWYMPLAIVGSLSFMFMFAALPSLRIVNIIANNTLFIMCLHYFMFTPWKETVLPKYGDSLSCRVAGGLICCALFILIVCIYSLAANLLKRKKKSTKIFEEIAVLFGLSPR